MARPAQTPRAVLLDALGTLVELDDPVAGLQRALSARGVTVGARAVGGALRVEIDHYRAEHHVAVDAPTLAELRRGCARVFGAALGEPVAHLGEAELHDALLEGLRFRAFDDVIPALAALRARGTALAVVSNWDVSLHQVLADTGLAASVDVVLTSAEEHTQKPEPALFLRALERLGGVPPDQALHVGDDLVADVAGARAAGIEPLLIDREGAGGPSGGARVIRTLAELSVARR